jgi:hypothetical protein
MSGLTKEQKIAKREAGKRPTPTTRNGHASLIAWDSGKRGQARSYKIRPYRGKSERRRVIKERREERKND